MLKRIIKKFLLLRKGIDIDFKTDINMGVQITSRGNMCILRNSHVHINYMGEGCFLENVYAYGDIELGNYVSISGPGTILHSEVGKISIGSFSSIAENVSIQEFNHHLNHITSSALGHIMLHDSNVQDFTTKGNVVINEDCWIGSNVVILSGCNIGRGAVIGAGSVVTKDVPAYAVVIGNPAKVIKYRFNEDVIGELERLQWWKWETEKILKNRNLFIKIINNLEDIKNV